MYALRRVDRLSGGMRVRLKVWEHKTMVVRTVEYAERRSDGNIDLRFFKTKTDKFDHNLGMILYPDDYLEIVS